MTLSIVSDLQHYDSQLAEVDKMLEQMYKMLGCTLTTIPGVNVITAVKILAIQMVQLSSKGTPRNPVVRACYEKRKAEGKTSQQALYFQTINQYHLWNVKKRYGVPYASHGKCWRK